MDTVSRISVLVLIIVSLTSLCIWNIQQSRATFSSIIVPDDYPTIIDAIGNATDGDRIFIRKGTYDEKPIETNKSLSLIGEGAELTKIILHPSSRQVPYEGMGMNGPYVENYTVYENSIIIYANNTTISNITISSNGEATIVGEKSQIINSTIAVAMLSLKGPWSNIIENNLKTTLIVNGSYSRIEQNNANALHLTGSYLTVLNNKALGTIGVRGEYCKIDANNAIGITDGYGITTYGAGIISLSGSYCEVSSNIVKGIRIEAFSCFVHDNKVNENKNGGTGSITGNGNIVVNNLFDHLAYGIELSGLNNIIYSNNITRNTIGLVGSGKSNRP